MSISSLPMPPLPSPPNLSNPYQKIRPSNNISKMQFPSDMGKYYMAFQFAEYSAAYNVSLAPIVNDFNKGLTALFGREPNKAIGAKYGIGQINAHIALPIPVNIVDDQQLDYNAQNLTNVAGKAAKSVIDYFTGQASTTAQQQLGTAGAIASAVTQFGEVFAGETVNPFLAMMFNGPRFKTHQFGWRFSPKTSAETDEIVKIVNTFKAKSLPNLQFGTFFAYPDVCLISIYPDNTRERTLKFKPAVITQTSVHYAPSGVPSFFAGSNGPAEIELKIQLSEISIWTNNDFPGYYNP